MDDELPKGKQPDMRSRRKNNWWEPMYIGDASDRKFVVSDWNFENNKGPQYSLFRSRELDSGVHKIEAVNFENCDFEGAFDQNLIFKKCSFTLCDFGLSKFRRVKFTDCTFDRSSFSQCTLDNCEFRSCEYSNISFSGNETQIPKTLITEPYRFIFGGKAYLEKLPKGISKWNQKLRFEETRSALSRAILANLQSEGAEDTYYDAVRTATVCEDRSRFAKGALKILNCKKNNNSLLGMTLTVLGGAVQCLSALFSLALLIVIGFLNGWGGNISRVLFLGVTNVIAVSCIMMSQSGESFALSFRKALEVFLLFGYTNHTTPNANDFDIVFVTALLGMFWYALAIPTIVNRLTRSRG